MPEPKHEPLPVQDAARAAASLRALIADVRLSPSQRRIAAYLLDHTDEAVFLTGTEIAERAGVSQPSVTRFAVALGFNGFPHFRDALRRAVFAGTAAESQRQELNEYQELVSSEIRDLERLRESLGDADHLRGAASRLAASRPLPVIGLRISAPLAHFFGYLAAKVLPDVRVLDAPGSALEDGLIQAAEAGADTVLAIGMPRYPRELAEGLTSARQLGLHVVLITDRPIGGLIELADDVLTAPVSSYAVFDSHAAPTVLCSALLHSMLDVLGPDAHRRLEEFDVRATERRTFLEP